MNRREVSEVLARRHYEFLHETPINAPGMAPPLGGVTRDPIDATWEDGGAETRAHARWKGGAMLAVLAIALSSVGTCALAQERTEDCAHVEAMPGAVVMPLTTWAQATAADVLVMAPKGTGRVLCYHNHPAKVSNAGSHVIASDGVEVRVTIRPGADEANRESERMTIVAPDGWMVWPADYADAPVSDGSALTVTVFGGMM